MPVKVANNLPAIEILEREQIFVMKEDRAAKQDIRELNILILNLMPVKQDTEVQLLRLLSNTPLQMEVTFLHPMSHESKNTAPEHLQQFYKTFPEVKGKKFDGMIITGAPVEMMAFEDVAYWEELSDIMEWTKTHVTSTLHICWGAQAALYYHYGIKKYPLEEKLFGVFPHDKYGHEKILQGLDDQVWIPHSRHSEVRQEDIEKIKTLKILLSSEESGVAFIISEDGRQVFSTGHAEYDRRTLDKEYKRDLSKDLPIDSPKNYYENNDDLKNPVVNWRSHAYILFSNWLNYYVYQVTPYNVNHIK
ncbi:MAG TPA: homoserine O-succinyltransferase [Epulopiscium sp.]|nr:homoserine O-succinyltransferase [Candidatus Epulonipiscium sp.]